MVKRIIAWFGIILLAGLYIATFVCALISTPATRGLMFASLGMTVIVPVVLWVFIRLYDKAHQKDDKQISASEMRKYNKRIKNGEKPEDIAKEIEERYGVKNEE